MSEEPGGKIGRALRAGARLAVTLSGAATGAATGDPLMGAAAGWAAGEALSIGEEVIGRVTERAAVRVGAAVTIIATDSQEHRDRGERPRTDGFFDDRGALRAEAHELLEAILLASANCFEERKLPYLAHMFNGVAHDADVSPPDSLYLARTADQLTFRQLQGLAVCGRHGTGDVELERELAHIDAQHHDGSMSADPAFLREFDDLADRGLIGATGPDEVVRNPVGVFGGAPPSDGAAQAVLTQSGMLLQRLMRLDEMPEADRWDWIEALRGRPR